MKRRQQDVRYAVWLFCDGLRYLFAPFSSCRDARINIEHFQHCIEDAEDGLDRTLRELSP